MAANSSKRMRRDDAPPQRSNVPIASVGAMDTSSETLRQGRVRPMEDKIQESDLQFQKKSYPLFLDSTNGLTQSSDGSRFTVDLSRSPTHIPKGALNVHTTLVSATVPWEWYNLPTAQTLNVRLIDTQHTTTVGGTTYNYINFEVPLLIPAGHYTIETLGNTLNDLLVQACLDPTNNPGGAFIGGAAANLTNERSCPPDIFRFRETAQGRLTIGAQCDNQGRQGGTSFHPYPEEVRVSNCGSLLAELLGWDTSSAALITLTHPMVTPTSTTLKAVDRYWYQGNEDKLRCYFEFPGTAKHKLYSAHYPPNASQVNTDYFIESLYVEVDYASMGLNSKMERSITLGAVKHKQFQPGSVIEYDPPVAVPVECYDNMTDDSHNILEFRLVNQNRLPVNIGSGVNWSIVVLIEWEQVIDKERILRSRLQTKYH